MRVLALILALLAAMCASASDAAFEDDVFECDFDRWHVGAGASLVLPQGGGAMRRVAGAEVRAGYYMTEMWTAEFAASRLENVTGLSAGFMWHWWGYERFDPFFTYGAKGWLDGFGAGPYGGIGALWNIDDYWSLRLDFDATLAVGAGEYMVYSLTAGIRRTF